MRNKNYNKAPLPFQGQKRNFVKKFKDALTHFPENALYVDLFGGSGLLSNTVKKVYPNARVIYNDFDNYSKRLQNISKTNLLISDLFDIAKGYEKKAKISEPLRSLLLKRIEKENGFVDFITLSGQLLFSGKYAKNIEELKKQTFYNKISGVVYSCEDYLTDVEIVSMDYRELFEKYKDFKNVVLILDPPYLSTDVKSYGGGSYWKLSDYLNILKLTENKSFFYFTSNKSQILELIDWLSHNNYGYNLFENVTRITTTNHINYSSTYEDIMLYKKELID